MKTPPPFTDYLISGVWMDYKGQVSHYAVHQHLNPGVSGAVKYSREETINLVETSVKPFHVWGWDYKTGRFLKGEKIIIYEGRNGKLLWTAKMEDKKKDLKHLINLDWFNM